MPSPIRPQTSQDDDQLPVEGSGGGGATAEVVDAMNNVPPLPEPNNYGNLRPPDNVDFSHHNDPVPSDLDSDINEELTDMNAGVAGGAAAAATAANNEEDNDAQRRLNFEESPPQIGVT